MSIQYVGSLPVSSVNLGLAASINGLTAEIARLGIDLDKFTGALSLQADITSALPPDPTFPAAFAGALDLAKLTEILTPANWVTLNADASTDLAAELALVQAQLDIVGEITGTLSAGLDAGSLTGWTYAGRARGFGTRLQAATAGGFGGVDPDTEVSALIIGCASFSSWGSFSAGFNTGESADEDLGETTTEERLQCQGTLGGGQWNTGAQDVFARLDLVRLRLEGTKAALLAQLDIAAGLNLPDPGDLLDLALQVDLDLALENLASVQTDLTAEIGSIQVRIDAVADLSAEISAQLSAAGLSLWSYSGRAGDLGAEFAPETHDGLPDAGGPDSAVYGLCIASASPSAWASFGQITATGA